MKYGFIGCGNMGGAVAQALSKTTNDILLSDRSGKGAALAEKLGCQYGQSLCVATSCDRIFLAVKPQMMETALAPIKETLKTRKPLLISMAAGLTIARIEEILGFAVPVIRIMPNTPVLVEKGMIPYCANSLVTDSVLEDFLADMVSAGCLDRLDEALFDVATALSGSGPAYLYLFAEALADGAIACGLPKEQARMYIASTMAGAAEMLLTTGKEPAQLKQEVCSPCGSTIAGINVLEDKGLPEASAACIAAAYKRNIELGR